ncbi:phosphatidylglycerophosphatase A [Acetomicrobium flavidum]|uniref:Phosphatidylglycerophosphatase A n=1 Tax=Acetomicrobium flavidum TaxID=49896 RepID=A0ABY1JE36_9BACT|nr:phosphatidylglycerophosphatase A [Acetomicrobium flavidum]
MKGNAFTEMATLWGIGRISSMPGTLGSCVAAIPLFFVHIPLWAIILVMLSGIYVSDVYSKNRGEIDPKEVVIDEVVGTWIALYGYPPSYIIAGLFLFRILDIFKPFPISWSEKAPGGWGIMADDVVGGMMANFILFAVDWLYFKGGFVAIFAG